VERASTPHLEHGRRGLAPRAVVVHTTDGGFVGTRRWFADPASGVSSHYLVALDGTVVQFVDEADTAFHAGMAPTAGVPVLGDDPPNLCTLGIEFADEGDPHSVERPDAQYEAGALLLAGISRRWGIPLDHDHVVAHRLINPHKTCPGNLDLDHLVTLAAAFAAADAEAERRCGEAPRLVVMVPARNAAAELARFLASVERFADAVVALDDGSTDDTAAILEAHPLVEVVLRNPVRDTYAGWDDGANRARLLDAAHALAPAPDWLLSLDVDERITDDDARVLREFVDRDALPGLAYGFECFRMWDDGCDPRSSYVYRLFAPRPGDELPREQLHFDPVPVAIPPERHVRTTLRIQHWGSADDAARRARIAKYDETDPEHRYATGFGGVDDVPATVVSWTPRPVDLPVVVERRPARTREHERPRLVVMVPARNAASDLPGFFASVERFADAVVALDDGSTDDTAMMLASHPLVHTLLRNPRRETYEGWDDAGNRNRLLAAAAEADPDWVLVLDADERITPDDAEALREFLTTDALPGFAYGMRCFRMIGDPEHYDHADIWVYRLFAYREGQSFPETRLHFVPVPTDIPRARWMETTIRIQHFASITQERRRARFAKYREADPEAEFQAGYDHLLREPRELLRFEPRPPGLPVLLGAATPERPAFDPEAPVLSAVVISRDDEARIERTVRSVVEQESDEPFEVIVVTSGTDRTAAIVREQFPSVRVVALDHTALPGEARNAGLRFARGDYVSFPGSHVELPPGSIAARIRAHDAGWTMVTGTTHNGNDTRSGWAAYFLDHSSVLPGRPAEQLSAAPAHCSYERGPLLAVGGFPDDVRAGEDTWANHALFTRGYTAYRASDVPLVHHNRSTTPWRLARHHFGRGRALTMFVRANGPERTGDARVRRALRGYPKRRLRTCDANVERWGGDLLPRYRKVRPLVRLGVLAAYCGSWWEYARPSRRDAAPSPEPATGHARAVTVAEPLTVAIHERRSTPAPFADRRAIFVHVPKTAGSTLLRVMEREYAPAPVAMLYGNLSEKLEALRALGPGEQRKVRAVAGHMAMGLDHDLAGASAYLTILRDPVERIISHYHYVRSRPHEPGHARAMEGIDSLDDYVRRSVFAAIVNNGQTRLLGGDVGAMAQPADAAALERALAALTRPDVVVGVQDRFDEFLLLACRAFGWGLPAYRNENVGVGRPRAAELSDETRALIREHNALDVALYEEARTRVERELALVPDLEAELTTLRLAGRWPD
jgi:glycosyltransferase involved in cell wall biosynthesis